MDFLQCGRAELEREGRCIVKLSIPEWDYKVYFDVGGTFNMLQQPHLLIWG
jgi:hypothetical protein